MEMCRYLSLVYAGISHLRRNAQERRSAAPTLSIHVEGRGIQPFQEFELSPVRVPQLGRMLSARELCKQKDAE